MIEYEGTLRQALARAIFKHLDDAATRQVRFKHSFHFTTPIALLRKTPNTAHVAARVMPNQLFDPTRLRPAAQRQR